MADSLVSYFYIVRILLSASLLLYGSSPAAGETIRMATWNLFNLHYEIGEPLRQGAVAQSETDYNVLRKYRDRIKADVIALQEVNGPKVRGVLISRWYSGIISACLCRQATFRIKRDKSY